MSLLIRATTGVRAERRRVADAVLAISRGDAPRLPTTTAGRDDLLAALRRHRIAPLAHVRLRDHDPDLSAALRPDRDGAMQFHVHATACLAGVRSVLGDVDWIVVKGPVLSQLAHPVPGLRTYGDLDLLIAPDRMADACDRLAAAGWRLIDRPASLRMTPPPGEIHWVSPQGILLDLHWTLINSPVTQQAFTLDAADLVARSRDVDLGLASVRTLGVADTLVHTCLHAALTGAHRMVLLLDADHTARAVTDWDEVVTRANDWGAGPAVWLVLARSRVLLGTPLPADLHRRLRVTAGLRLVSRVVDRARPVHTLRADASWARLLARSARPDGRATLREFRHRTRRGVADRVREQPATAEWRMPDPDDLAVYLGNLPTATAVDR